MLDENWKFEIVSDSEVKPDIFGINGGESQTVKLRLSMRAAHLLQEEFPLSAPHIYKEDYKHYLFEAHCNSFIAIGRFILGLIDEIEVLEPAALIEHLNEQIAKRRCSPKFL